MPRSKEDTFLARIASNVGLYEASRTGAEHSLHCDRTLRALDGLREIKNLPEQQSPRGKREYNRPAYHRVAGRFGQI